MTNNSSQPRRRSITAITIGITSAVAIGLIGVVTMTISAKRASHSRLGEVTVNGQAFTVEFALTPDEQQLGLMFRKQMPERHGMLFVFEQSEIRRFWMRDTFIPLDIIFIDADRRVINVVTMPALTDQMCASTSPARYVLELHAGSADRFNISPGAQVMFDLPDTD